MTNRGGASLHVQVMRVCALNADGSHSANNVLYVTDNLVKIDFNPDIEAGMEVSDRNAAGNVAVAFKTQDIPKRLTMNVEIIAPDPELEVLLTGGSTYVTGATNVMGMQYPAMNFVGSPNGVSIEAWTHSVVNGNIDSAVNQPYMRWVFPKMYLRKGNRTMDINRMASAFEGFALENPLWGTGPQADWPLDSSKVVQWMYTSTAPTPAIGAQKSLA
jgi:hypothetical protein